MGVVSIRLNKKEEEILDFLAETFEEDRSTLIKHSLREMYEDLEDRKFVENFEKKENKSGKTNFISSSELRKEINKSKKV